MTLLGSVDAGDGYLLCGHGSRDPVSVAGFERIAQGLAPRLAGRPFLHGFMELAEPDLDQATGALVRAGVRRVLAVPGFLFAARHVREDLPRLLSAAAARHGVDWRLGRELGADPRLVAALTERAQAAMPAVAARAGTGLLLIGAGSSDDGANAALATLADTLGRSLGCAAAVAGYASVAVPTVGAAVRQLEAQGCGRILLLPWFLTEGKLLAAARAEARGAVTAGAALIEAAVLGDHALVLETLAARARELAQAASP
jgi:sirohydrochlorin cobaltochelatase